MNLSASIILLKTEISLLSVFQVDRMKWQKNTHLLPVFILLLIITFIFSVYFPLLSTKIDAATLEVKFTNIIVNVYSIVVKVEAIGTGYTEKGVRYRKNGTSTWYNLSTASRSNPVELTITGLLANTSYDIQAVCWFNNEIKALSTIDTVKTTPATVLKVYNITDIKTNSVKAYFSVTISGSPSLNTLEYVVTKVSTGQPIKRVLLATNIMYSATFSDVIGDLSAGTEYYVNLIGYMATKEYVSSDPVTFKTKLPIINPPTIFPVITLTPVPSPTATPKPTASVTPTLTPKPTATVTPKPTASATPTLTPKPTATITPKPTASATPTLTALPSPTTTMPAHTPRPSVTDAATPALTVTPNASAEVTLSPTPSTDTQTQQITQGPMPSASTDISDAKSEITRGDGSSGLVIVLLGIIAVALLANIMIILIRKFKRSA
jgi:hypothetical protein